MNARALRTTLVIVSALVVAFTFGSQWATATDRASQPPAIPVGVGDVVKVAGAPIGCAVRRHGKQRAVDCRRLGALGGTYGTLVTRSNVLVVRFRDATTGTVVFSARHGGTRARTCEGATS